MTCVTQDVWHGKSGPYDRESMRQRESSDMVKEAQLRGGGGGRGAGEGQGERGGTREVLGQVTETAWHGMGKWITYKTFAPRFITRTLSLPLLVFIRWVAVVLSEGGRVFYPGFFFMCMCHAWSFMSKRMKKYIRRSVPEQYFIIIVLYSIHSGRVSGQ